MRENVSKTAEYMTLWPGMPGTRNELVRMIPSASSGFADLQLYNAKNDAHCFGVIALVTVFAAC